jgi:hypothetical protein
MAGESMRRTVPENRSGKPLRKTAPENRYVIAAPAFRLYGLHDAPGQRPACNAAAFRRPLTVVCTDAEERARMQGVNP